MAILSSVRLLLVALWLGAAVFFSGVVAPTLFDVLRGYHLPNANEIAGTIVTRLLGIVNIAGFVVSLSLLVTAPLLGRRRAMHYAEMISLAIVAIMTGLSQWAISPRMLALRAAMQLPIDQVARDDPRLVAFNTLHAYSVVMMGGAIVSGVAVLLLAARRTNQRINPA